MRLRGTHTDAAARPGGSGERMDPLGPPDPDGSIWKAIPLA